MADVVITKASHFLLQSSSHTEIRGKGGRGIQTKTDRRVGELRQKDENKLKGREAPTQTRKRTKRTEIFWHKHEAAC